MQAEGRVRRVIVIDCDVHQGNGTAQITQNDPTIFTFSIHAEKNYPFRKIPGDLDVGLPDGTNDPDYLTALQPNLTKALALARADLAIYLAGADVYVGDKLGRLAMTKEGIAARDHFVLATCCDWKLPVAVVMAGGYGKIMEESVGIYLQTIEIVQKFASIWKR
jgi:acetoin utilization deacetylase AcuC-like enzyme